LLPKSLCFQRFAGHIRSEQGLERAANPRGERPLAIDGPVEHGAAVDLLEEASEFSGVAGLEFAGSEGSVEKLPFGANGGELRQRA
jgi:hypothetical protein